MAAKKKPTTIDPNAHYRVKLKSPIKIGRATLRVRDVHRLKGAHLEANLEAVESYEAV